MPYTRALFDSIPRLENPVHSTLNTINGQPPNLISQAKGCGFAPRCAHSTKHCYENEPPFFSKNNNSHRSACWYPLTQTYKGSETIKPSVQNKLNKAYK